MPHTLQNANHVMANASPCHSELLNHHAMPHLLDMPCHSCHKPSPCNTHANLIQLVPFPMQLDAIALSPALNWERGQARTSGSSSPRKRSRVHSSSHSCSHSPPTTAGATMPPQNVPLETPTPKGGTAAILQVAKAKAETSTLHFFKGAQQCMAPLLVPYVWGTTSMSTPNVPHPSSGMEERLVCEETSKADLSSLTVSQCVSISKPWQGVQTHPTPHDTYVQGAGSQDMGPSSVLRHRRANPLTPYKPNAWHSQLDQHSLLEKYPTLYHSLIHGFDLGIPSISQSYIPTNSPSINKLPAEYEEIVEKEFHKGRYLGPFLRADLESIMGPFQSSPLSLVPKPGKPGKFHGVHDFSHPCQSSTNPVSSINFAINLHDFPCTWGTFSTVSLMIFRLPLGSQASI